MNMQISVLSEDCANYNSVGILAEHGLSLLVEHDGRSIIFDTGQSSVFIRNAERMGKDIRSVDYLVLSHAHFDHTAGLPHYVKAKEGRVPLVCHPGVFERKLDVDGTDVGSPLSLAEARESFDVNLVEETTKIDEGIHLLVDVPRVHEDPGTVIYHLRDGEREPDPVSEDSNLVLRTDKGLFVVVGCSHSGVVNIVREAQEAFDEQVYGIAGGFHLIDAGRERLRNVIDCFREMGIEVILPCHCTGLEGTYLMGRELGARKINSGQTVKI